MTQAEFRDFVKRKSAERPDNVDWVRRKADWLHELNALYEQMEKHLLPYTRTGEIQIERAKVQLREDYLGTYDADQLNVKIGFDKIFAKPVGTLLIGACGRVDLSGPRSTLKIVLADMDGSNHTVRPRDGEVTRRSNRPFERTHAEEKGWYITTSDPHRVVFPFSKGSFLDAIMEVSGG